MLIRSATVVALLTTLLAIPAAAQDRFIDISVFATWVNPNGESTIRDGADDLGDIDFESDQGFGAAVNVFWTNRISTEFALSIVDPDLNVNENDAGRDRLIFQEPLEMMPLTAVLQFHFLGSGRFDPYVGVGGGYVLFQDIEDQNDLDDIDFERIDFEDDIGLVVNAGLKIGLTNNFGLYLDGKYMPLEAAATPVFADGEDDEFTVAIDPLILAAGVSFSF